MAVIGTGERGRLRADVEIDLHRGRERGHRTGIRDRVEHSPPCPVDAAEDRCGIPAVAATWTCAVEVSAGICWVPGSDRDAQAPRRVPVRRCDSFGPCTARLRDRRASAIAGRQANGDHRQARHRNPRTDADPRARRAARRGNPPPRGWGAGPCLDSDLEHREPRFRSRIGKAIPSVLPRTPRHWTSSIAPSAVPRPSLSSRNASSTSLARLGWGRGARGGRGGCCGLWVIGRGGSRRWRGLSFGRG